MHKTPPLRVAFCETIDVSVPAAYYRLLVAHGSSEKCLHDLTPWLITYKTPAAFIVVALLVIFLLALFPVRAHTQNIENTETSLLPIATSTVATTTPLHVQTDLERRQEIWLDALQWCESRGVETAVNKHDLDGTPSYYSFQFKPPTFLNFGLKYGVLASGTTLVQAFDLMASTTLQRDIVRHMINDAHVRISSQFPDCVRRKIGKPPTK